MREEPQPAFSREALSHYLEGSAAGSLLRLSPTWARVSYWLIVGAIATAILGVCVIRVNEYAVGPAVVQFPGRTDVISRAAGTVVEVLVQPGQRVQSGSPMARLDAQPEFAELEKLHREFELQLIRILEEPANQAARTDLASVRAQHESAQTRVDERWIRAPEAGVVGSLRVRAGQSLKSGDLVATINGRRARSEIVALIPGQYRPRLRLSMPLRLELNGFAFAYQDFTLDDIGEQLLGPSEAGRYLGSDIADALSTTGPTVVVRASLASASFAAEGNRYEYYDGMLGTANLLIGSRSILLSLIPGLDDLIELPL